LREDPKTEEVMNSVMLREKLSDQPKPTTEPIPCKAGQGFIHWEQRHADKCLICHPQPKPTTGEWTVAMIRGYLLRNSHNEAIHALADAHNAALAAAIAKAYGEGRDNAWNSKRVRDLETIAAAQQPLVEMLMRVLHSGQLRSDLESGVAGVLRLVTGEEILAESAKQIFENWKADQPTGEWTAERLRQCGIESTTMAQYLCDEINAALAAEREKHNDTLTAAKHQTLIYQGTKSNYQKEIWQLRSQLEAETANSTRLACELSTSQTQLAAETEIVNKVWSALGITEYHQANGKTIWELVSKLRTQLAAAQAEVDAHVTRCRNFEGALDSAMAAAAEKWTRERCFVTLEAYERLEAAQKSLVDALHQIGLLAGSGDKGDTPQVKLEAIARRCGKEIAKVKEGK
jgi:hypothetical protein